MIENILLATDGSGSGERATKFAASLALRYHARVTVVHAFTPLPRYSDLLNYNKTLYETSEAAQSLLEDVASRLREMGVGEVEVIAHEGPAVNVILGVAETCQADLIVLGARGLSTWQGIPMGSVSLSVTQRAEVPVLVVK